MNLVDFSTFTLESSVAVFIICLGVKLLRMRIGTRSSCCRDHVEVITNSPGISTPISEV